MVDTTVLETTKAVWTLRSSERNVSSDHQVHSNNKSQSPALNSNYQDVDESALHRVGP